MIEIKPDNPVLKKYMDLLKRMSSNPKIVQAMKDHLEATKNLVKLIEEKPEAADRFFKDLFNLHEPR